MEGGREKPSVRAGSEELLFEILKEGLFWAALGRPSEVMPFLRGKLLGNGFSPRAKEELQWLLDKLEKYYNYVAVAGRVEEKHLKAIKSFYRDIVVVLSVDRA
ncbi:hypothetical protein [Thermococcus stetteri]|uniref:hypothetical protein n=1 Tax=Thermococcus stetteri TaxID=49900 RepID=UPI001AE5FC9F|nr:hypothetical protein [Thermococcus stetteri]MBP1911093.1 hypothetical protein [Thermococcus stetteri]